MSKRTLSLLFVCSAVSAYAVWALPRWRSAEDAIQVAKLIIVASGVMVLVAVGLLAIHCKPRQLLAAVRRVAARRPRTTAVAAGLLVSIALLLVAEIVLYIVLPASLLRHEGPFHTVVDEDLGHRLIPGFSGRQQAYDSMTGRLVFDVQYTLDGDGHRVTPGEAPLEHRRTIALFGDSYVFGYGVNDDETVGHYLSQRMRDAEVINFAVPGWGTNAVLALLESKEKGFLPGGSEPSVGVYVFIMEHVLRNVGSMRLVNKYGVALPYYVLTDGVLERRGDFGTRDSWRSVAYWLLNKSQILKAAGFDWPPPRTASCLDLTVALIAACRDRFMALTGSPHYVVVLYPGEGGGQDMTQRLSAAGIAFLDYTELWHARDPEMHLKGDRHPSAEANRRLAELLDRDIATMLR